MMGSVKICCAVALIVIIASTGCATKDRGCHQPKGVLVEGVEEKDEHGRLFLNKFIEGSNISDGIEKSKVKSFKEKFGVDAYSGYFKIDQEKPKNFFFFLVKSKKKKVPLILWLNGGPGQTSLFGQFIENGPVGIDKRGNLYNRTNSLYEDYDILYLDQPVGAGFSFTNDSYPKSLEDIASDMEKFLCLFFRLFKEYLNIDLYIAGESYGVRAAAAFGVHIHQNMTGRKRPPGNLKGVMCGVGLFTDTLTQVDTSDLLLSLGLVDQHGYKELKDNINKMKKFITNSTTVKMALGIYLKTFGTTTNFTDPKFRLRRTGYLYNGNALKPTEPEEHVRFAELMHNKTFREDIHAGVNASFRGNDLALMMNLLSDLHRSIDNELATLLDKKTKVLVFLGQLDLKVSNVVTEKFLRNLSWTGAEKFKDAVQKPWWGRAEDKDFAGYFIKEDGLTLVKLLTSGHYPFFDQRDASNEMVRKFINNGEFITKTVNPKTGVYEPNSAKDQL
ncbi:venom serine carboxypeptidase-like [Ornithodoros turicata]|uniref:venom serine carboxypeptidase-like n=1 Tax=Ornithodoros turicata TaxID=34597 RepID=UPI003139CAEC